MLKKAYVLCRSRYIQYYYCYWVLLLLMSYYLLPQGTC